MKQTSLNIGNPNPYIDLNPNDVVFTPYNIARYIVEVFNPSGKCLDPCKGEGVFHQLLPKNSDWCEIVYGKNFYDYNKKVDWIVSNPPYSDFNRWLDHSFELADNVVYLCPIAKVFKSWGTLMVIKKYGGIRKIIFFKGSDCGFPFGFPVGAFHFKRNWKGSVEIDYYKNIGG